MEKLRRKRFKCKCFYIANYLANSIMDEKQGAKYTSVSHFILMPPRSLHLLSLHSKIKEKKKDYTYTLPPL